MNDRRHWQGVHDHVSCCCEELCSCVDGRGVWPFWLQEVQPLPAAHTVWRRACKFQSHSAKVRPITVAKSVCLLPADLTWSLKHLDEENCFYSSVLTIWIWNQPFFILYRAHTKSKAQWNCALSALIRCHSRKLPGHTHRHFPKLNVIHTWVYLCWLII